MDTYSSSRIDRRRRWHLALGIARTHEAQIIARITQLKEANGSLAHKPKSVYMTQDAEHGRLLVCHSFHQMRVVHVDLTSQKQGFVNTGPIARLTHYRDDTHVTVSIILPFHSNPYESTECKHLVVLTRNAILHATSPIRVSILVRSLYPKLIYQRKSCSPDLKRLSFRVRFALSRQLGLSPTTCVSKMLKRM